MSGNPQPLDYHEADQRYTALSRARHEALLSMQKAGEESADAEANFLKIRAQRMAIRRSEGKAQDEAKILADGDSADAKKAWAYKKVLDKVAAEKLEEIDANRAMLSKRVEWSMKVAPTGEQRPPVRRAA